MQCPKLLHFTLKSTILKNIIYIISRYSFKKYTKLYFSYFGVTLLHSNCFWVEYQCKYEQIYIKQQISHQSFSVIILVLCARHNIIYYITIMKYCSFIFLLLISIVSHEDIEKLNCCLRMTLKKKQSVEFLKPFKTIWLNQNQGINTVVVHFCGCEYMFWPFRANCPLDQCSGACVASCQSFVTVPTSWKQLTLLWTVYAELQLPQSVLRSFV